MTLSAYRGKRIVLHGRHQDDALAADSTKVKLAAPRNATGCPSERREALGLTFQPAERSVNCRRRGYLSQLVAV